MAKVNHLLQSRLKNPSSYSHDRRKRLTLQRSEQMLEFLLHQVDLSEADMGTIRCKECPKTWTVSTSKAETVIMQNHAFLNPGHKTVTVWTKPLGEVATL